ncbi:hypothetical protein [Streptomyces sp.]
MSSLTGDLAPQKIAAVARTCHERGFTFVLRSREEIRRFLTDSGLGWSSPASSRPTTGVRTTSRTTARAKP